MNSKLSIFGAATLLFSSAVLADESFVDYGRVLSTHPVYKNIKTYYPERECYTKHRHNEHYTSNNNQSRNSHTDALVGAIVGGVLGHQIGHGSTRDIATVAGAAVGASIVSSHKTERYKKHNRRDRHHHRHDVKTCETEVSSHYTRKLVGYDVTYKYQGEIFHTRMNRHPGKKVRLSISITPLD